MSQQLLPLLLLSLLLVRRANQELIIDGIFDGHERGVVADLRPILKEAAAAKGFDINDATFSLKSLEPDTARLTVAEDGRLVATGRLLREELCSASLGGINCRTGGEACVVKGLVRAQAPDSTGRFVMETVRIVVEDVDNSRPEFSVKREEKLIWENAQVGHSLSLSPATDADNGGHGSCSLVYRLTSCDNNDSLPNKAFALVVDTGSGRSPPRPQLRLQRQLDREVEDSFVFCLEAEDSFATATLTVEVVVQDVNDNSPKWSVGQNFSVAVSEAAPPDVLLRLLATDADARFGLVKYKTVDEDQLFTVDSNSGELRLNYGRHLDYEAARTHLVVVEASDNGAPPKSTTATVTVHVLDSNDNSPEFESLERYQSIAENNEKVKFMQSVTVKDRDSGDNSLISCHLDPVVKGKFFFRLDHNDTKAGTVTYSLMTNVTFDREMDSRIDIGISCHDNGVPKLTTTGFVYVTIIDLNDNPPGFEVSPIRVAAHEDTRVGFQLYRGRIVDPDADAGSSRLALSLSPDAAGHFSVRLDAGGVFVLSTAAPLDREICDSFNFTLTVNDTKDGLPLHSASVGVFVRVLDVNDCSPEFNATSVTFSVMENASMDSVVGVVTARDPDSGANGRVSYRLAEGSRRLFGVDAETGRLRLRGRLERDGPDGRARHVLELLAVDSGTRRLTGTATVTVVVIDSNDNRPKFRSPDPQTVNVTCGDAVPNFFLGVDSETFDLDEEEIGGGARYRLAETRRLSGVAPAETHTFKVDENSGQISISTAPQYCTSARYRLKLEVFELANHRDVSRKTVFVNVVDTGGSGRREGDAIIGRNGEGEGETRRVGRVEMAVAAILVVASVLLVAVVAVLLATACGRSRRHKYSKGTAIMSNSPPAISLPIGRDSCGAAATVGRPFVQPAKADMEVPSAGSIYKQRRRNASLEAEDDREGHQRGVSLTSSFSQQQLPRHPRPPAYQTMLPAVQLSASEGYMTCRDFADSPLAKRSVAVNSKKRPSEPNSLKSSYFTVSFV